jgi:3-oxoacyl-[acyl-carrier-protein] synthase-3
MNRIYGQISGWGSYVPEKVLTNFDLERMVDTSNEWIIQRSGIHERHIAGPEETTSVMSVKAAEQALRRADLQAADLELIIVANSSPDYLTPPVSSQVQHALGATDVPAFVVETGCTGFVYALSTAYQFIASGAYRTILVIGVEILSSPTRWTRWTPTSRASSPDCSVQRHRSSSPTASTSTDAQ